MQATETIALDKLLQLSVDHYGRMAELLRTLQQQLAENPAENIEEFNLSLASLQRKAEQIDRQLMAQVNEGNAESSEVAQALAKRRDLQADILELLEQTLPRAISIKSLLASEIHSLKAGRNALSGYKNHSGGQGRLINKRS